MKKLISLRKIVSLVIVIALVSVSSVSIMADEAQSLVVWGEVNYNDNTVEAYFDNSDIPYVTTVMFYLLGENDTFEGIDSAIRVGSAVAEPGEQVKCSIQVDDDIPDIGYYKLYAVSGGFSKVDGYSPKFRIMNSTNADASLAKVNDATQSTIGTVVYNEFKDAFGYASLPEWMAQYLYSIKADDYDGSFKTIADVNKAWENASYLRVVNNAPQQLLEKAIDVENSITMTNAQNEYYKAYKDETYVEYDKMNDVYSMQALDLQFKAAVAVANINNCRIADLDGVFKAFKAELGISEYMERYSKVSSSDFARQFDGFTATDALSVKTKFVTVLLSLEGASTENNNSSVILGGGGSGGGSGGGNVAVSGGSAGGIAPSAPQKIFADLDEGHWAYNPIIALNKMGIINGYNDGTFKSEATITREEFAKVVVVAFGLTDNGGEYTAFADAKDNWANEYIKIAYVNGVVNGIGNGNFGIGQKISRQDAAVMIWRAAKAKGISLGEGSEGAFADQSKIAEYAKASVGALSGAKIINGFEDGSFRPDNSITRAETAKIVYSVITK